MINLEFLGPGNSAEWLTAIVALLTALILIYQLWDLRKTVQNQTYQAVYSEMLNIDRFFFENWELRRHFYEGQELAKDEKTQVQAGIVAELFCDLFDDVYHQRSTMPPKTFKEWRIYMGDLFEVCPTLKRTMELRLKWYPRDYWQDVLGRDVKLKK